MIRSFIRVAALTGAAVVAISPAMAQVDDRLAAMATAWADASDFAFVVKTYGAGCITPILQTLPDPIKTVIAAAADLDAALDQLDVDARNDVVGRLEPCVSTMIVGDFAWFWVPIAVPGATEQRRGEVTVCLMEAVAPLSGEAKRRIVVGADFGAGVQALTTDPNLAGDVQARVQACL